MADRFIIREMTPADCGGRAFVHYTAWRETYRDIIDRRILDANTLEHCREVAERFPENTLVALDRREGERVIGFLRYEPEARRFASLGGASEISALYLLREYQGLGLGRRLLEAAPEKLPRKAVVLFAARGNERAIAFYEHMGFRLTGHSVTEALYGAELTVVEMVLYRGKETEDESGCFR